MIILSSYNHIFVLKKIFIKVFFSHKHVYHDFVFYFFYCYANNVKYVNEYANIPPFWTKILQARV